MIIAPRDDQVDEILDRPRPERRATDIILITNSGSAQRRMKNDVRAAQRQTSRRLWKDHVIANQHPHSAEIGSFENRKTVSSLPVQLMNGHVDFVVATDLTAIATEEEGGIVKRSVRLNRIV